jgi:hypothetical protein
MFLRGIGVPYLDDFCLNSSTYSIFQIVRIRSRVKL